MCQSGDTTTLLVKVAAHLAFEGVDSWKEKPVDRCIASIVSALQSGGIDMLGSCCGHGESLGEILLFDGRTLLITTPKGLRSHG